MATCKDCVHFDVCKEYLIKCAEHGEAERMLNPCVKFKNKADFVEVVRCKDCGIKGAAFCMAGDIPLTETTGEMFCSLGKRKKEG